MADEDYEFANAAPWEMAGRARPKKAPAPVSRPAIIPRPPPQVRQGLTEQLITVALAAEFRSPAPTAAGLPSGISSLPAFVAAAGPQTTSKGPRVAVTVNEANELSGVQGAFAAPILETNFIKNEYAGDDTDSDEEYLYGSRLIPKSTAQASKVDERFASAGDVESEIQDGPVQTTIGTAIPSYPSPPPKTEDELWVQPVHPPEEREGYPDLYPTGFKRINEGGWRERQGAPPDDTFVLPRGRHAEFDYRFFGPNNLNLTHIARKTNTHLSMPIDLRQPTLLMWGTKQAIQAAKRDLLELKLQVEDDIDVNVRRVGGWARIKAAPTDRMHAHYTKQIHAAKIRRAFRHTPLDGMIFPASGVFYWPTEIKPQTVLGLSYEALDSVRYENQCYIIYSRRQKLFKVLGDSQESVDSAIDRIFGIFCEAAAKQRRCNKMILIDPPSQDLPGTTVTIEHQHDLMDLQTTVHHTLNTGIQLTLGGRSPRTSFLRQWAVQQETIRAANNEYMRKAIQQGLRDVAYYRGYVKLKFYFGKIVMFGYKRSLTSDYQLQQYIEDCRAPQADGEVVRSLRLLREGVSDADVAAVLLAKCDFQNALNTDERGFRPVDFNPDAKALKNDRVEIEPQISVTFEIRLHDSNGRFVGVRLEVVFVRDPDSVKYRIAEYRWLKSMARGSTGDFYPINYRKGPVITKVHDLEAELAYEMELSTWDIFPDSGNYPVFDKFLQGVTVEDIPDEFDIVAPPEVGQPDMRRRVRRVVYRVLPEMSVVGMTQKTKYRYWIHKSHYYMEIVKYEYLPVRTASSLFPANIVITWKDLKIPADTRWAVSVGNSDWDDNFRKQMDVQLGCRGDWNADVDAFFKFYNAPTIHGMLPTWKSGDGFSECLGIVNEVKRLVRCGIDEVIHRKKLEVGGEDTGLVTWAGLPEYDA